MECLQCGFKNLDGMKFCGECGSKLGKKCPECESINLLAYKFCGVCGYNFNQPAVDNAIHDSQEETSVSVSEPENPDLKHIATESERKYITVLFSDLTGYTAMSEKLDPEDVKEITSKIFEGISGIIAKYEGFIEKYVGDAVMAIFGVPKSHEDDPVRAVKAAKEIHQLVDQMSPEIEQKINHLISMHTGINTGLVVTGSVDVKRGTHGVAGDTINLAARLSSIAKPGEILLDTDTCRLIEGQFSCEYVDTSIIKGKTDAVRIHKLLSQREKPVTLHRLSGLRASLVGRDVEMDQLSKAVEKLKKGKGRIFAINGAAGTGKSRLIEEFKDKLDLTQVQWIEGHAYAYSENIPYSPLIDLLNRLFKIDEKDSSENVREKIETGYNAIVSGQKESVAYIGGLYSLQYPGIEDVSPELWKSRLQSAVLALLSSLAQKKPTVFFLEDLHWADPSFVELYRRACLEITQPAVVLCTFRPTFSFLTGNQISSLGKGYHEINLRNLSLSVSLKMMESLLESETIPDELNLWAQKKAEGNPFYLEEMINSLIESNTLVKENDHWQLTRSITEQDIPASLHTLIAGRLDRLDTQAKQILQEASVIGRDFLYDILKRITELEQQIDAELSHLERIDLIRTRSFHPDIEYMFKHALTQEIVYNSLLKKKRRQIHEQIAQVMETVFKDRLAEFNETLAYHFVRGHSLERAVDYLIKSGEKSLARYAVEEAHEYFQNAYDLVTAKKELSEEEKDILIDILNSWGYSFYYLGEINIFVNIFKSHQTIADSLSDISRKGMYYVWLGIALFMAGKTEECFDCLIQALKLGKEAENQKVAGYACTWLTWACAEMGRFSAGITYGEKAQEIAKLFPADQYLYFKSLSGICYINRNHGNIDEVFKGARSLLEYGDKTANNRSKVFGLWMNAFGSFDLGDYASAIKYCTEVEQVALDNAYALFGSTLLGPALFLDGQFDKAEKKLQSVLTLSGNKGMGQCAEVAKIFLAPILIIKGEMKQGAELMETARKVLAENKRKIWYAWSEFILGEVNAQMATGPKPSLSIMAKNIGFLFKNVPFASKKAEEHYKKAIEYFHEIDAKCFLGQAYLSLGKLYKANKKTMDAIQNIEKAIALFKECNAELFLEQSRRERESLN